MQTKDIALTSALADVFQGDKEGMEKLIVHVITALLG
jgi:hypothetical protein